VERKCKPHIRVVEEFCTLQAAYAYGPAVAAATPSSLAPVKSRMVYLSGAGCPGRKGR